MKFKTKTKKNFSNPTVGLGMAGYQAPPEPANISSQLPPTQPSQAPLQRQMPAHPMIPMSTSMITSIKNSKKGKIPAGLARYLAAKKAGKNGQ